MVVHPGQQRVKDSKARFKVLRAPRRWGKTVYMLEELRDSTQWQIEGYDLQGFDTWYIVRTYKQAERVFWQRLLKHLRETNCYRRSYPSDLLVTTEPYGAVIQLHGSDSPDRLRGDGLRMVGFDEYSETRPTVWPQVVRPMLWDLSPHSKAIFMMTRDRMKSHASKLCRLADDPQNAEWEFFDIDPVVEPNPHLPKGELESMRVDMSDDAYRAEILNEAADEIRALDPALLKPALPRAVKSQIIVSVHLRSWVPDQHMTRHDSLNIERSAIMVGEVVVEDDARPELTIREYESGVWSTHQIASKLMELKKKYKRKLSSVAGSVGHIEALRPILERLETRDDDFLPLTPYKVPSNPYARIDQTTYTVQGPLGLGLIHCLDSIRPILSEVLDDWPDTPVADAAFALALLIRDAMTWYAEEEDTSSYEPLDQVSGY